MREVATAIQEHWKSSSVLQNVKLTWGTPANRTADALPPRPYAELRQIPGGSTEFYSENAYVENIPVSLTVYTDGDADADKYADAIEEHFDLGQKDRGFVQAGQSSIIEMVRSSPTLIDEVDSPEFAGIWTATAEYVVTLNVSR